MKVSVVMVICKISDYIEVARSFECNLIGGNDGFVAGAAVAATVAKPTSQLEIEISYEQ